MTRRRVLTDAEVQTIKAEYKQGVKGFGYESLAKK